MKKILSKYFALIIYLVAFFLILIISIKVKRSGNLFYAFPELFGSDERIVNGNFEKGLEGWQHDHVEIKNINGTNNVFLKVLNNKRLRIRQNIYVIAGKSYKLNFTLTGPKNGACFIYRERSSKEEKFFWCEDVNSNKTYTFEFIPVSSGENVLYLSAERDGEYFISNVSLKILSNKLQKAFFFGSFFLVFLILIYITYLFFTKFRAFLIHYFIALSLVLISFSNFNLVFISAVLVFLVFWLSLKIKWFTFISLLGLIIFGFLKRFILLGQNCFWWDEFLTEYRVWFSASKLFNHPMTARCLLYSFILKFYASFISFFNNKNYLTEFQLRLPHAIIGTLAIFIIYFLGKSFKDRITGLLMAFFAAISSFLIYYAREARFYPFVLFFSACLIHAVVLILYRDHNQIKKTILYYSYYSFAAICGMHTHQGFWLLFAASNIFLFAFEFISILFLNENKKKAFLILALILAFLVLPVLTTLPGIFHLLDKGSNSNIISAQKLVPELSNAFFVKVHKELWSGIKYSGYMQFIIPFSLFILLLSKKTRLFSLYLCTVILVTFVSLRNMGTFREPFRVKYITFMWIIEMLAIVISITNIADVLIKYIKNNNFAVILKCLLFSFVLTFFQIDLNKIYRLPFKPEPQESFRKIAATINDLAHSNDVIVSYDEGLTALNYYKRVYSSNWNLLNIDQLNGKYKDKYIVDGYLFCLLNKKDFSTFNNNIFQSLSLGKWNYYLFKTIDRLDIHLQNNVAATIFDGFTGLKKINSLKMQKRLWYTDNFIVNGEFTNGFNGWSFSRNSDKIFANVINNSENNFLVITNNFSKTLVISQSFQIPTNGLYALTFNTAGFNNGGRLSVSSLEINYTVYTDELKKCLFTKSKTFNISKSQEVTFKIYINPNDVALLSNIGFYKLDKKE